MHHHRLAAAAFATLALLAAGCGDGDGDGDGDATTTSAGAGPRTTVTTNEGATSTTAGVETTVLSAPFDCGTDDALAEAVAPLRTSLPAVAAPDPAASWADVLGDGERLVVGRVGEVRAVTSALVDPKVDDGPRWTGLRADVTLRNGRTVRVRVATGGDGPPSGIDALAGACAVIVLGDQDDPTGAGATRFAAVARSMTAPAISALPAVDGLADGETTLGALVRAAAG